MLLKHVGTRQNAHLLVYCYLTVVIQDYFTKETQPKVISGHIYTDIIE